MPSTLVHVGFAALLASALLGPYFDLRSLVVVGVVTAFPDLDTFVGLWVMEGAHRTLFHNLALPVLVLVVLAWDVYVREESIILRYAGASGYRVVVVSVVGGWIVAHIFLDAFFNGVNLLWPVYDQYIDLSGEFYFSNQDGFVQTFIDLEPSTDGSGVQIAQDDVRGSRSEYHYYTGVDPGPSYPAEVERRFPIADRGTLFVVMVTGYVVASYRLIGARVADRFTVLTGR